MSISKSRREVLQGSVAAALFAALPGIANADESENPDSALQGGTNPVIKVPGELEARIGGSLRVTIYPATSDVEGDIYEVRALELTMHKDAEGKITVNGKLQGIDGIEGKEFATTVTVKDVATPMIATIKLDYLSGTAANRVIAVGAFNGLRSGIATVILKKV